jgi:hypothetical protein
MITLALEEHGDFLSFETGSDLMDRPDGSPATCNERFPLPMQKLCLADFARALDHGDATAELNRRAFLVLGRDVQARCERNGVDRGRAIAVTLTAAAQEDCCHKPSRSGVPHRRPKRRLR